jgi:hypothetical protein
MLYFTKNAPHNFQPGQQPGQLPDYQRDLRAAIPYLNLFVGRSSYP